MSVTGFFYTFPNNKWVLHIGNKIYPMYDLNGVGSIKNHQKLKPKYLPETSRLTLYYITK